MTWTEPGCLPEGARQRTVVFDRTSMAPTSSSKTQYPPETLDMNPGGPFTSTGVPPNSDPDDGYIDTRSLIAPFTICVTSLDEGGLKTWATDVFVLRKSDPSNATSTTREAFESSSLCRGGTWQRNPSRQTAWLSTMTCSPKRHRARPFGKLLPETVTVSLSPTTAGATPPTTGMA